MLRFIRAEKRPYYASVSSQTVRDPRIGAVAKAVILYRADQADDFDVTNEALCRALRIGRRALAAALQELTAAGYYEARAVRNERGQMVTKRTLREESETAPATGQREAEGAKAKADPFAASDQRREAADRRQQPRRRRARRRRAS